jgi:hypothetical protein
MACFVHLTEGNGKRLVLCCLVNMLTLDSLSFQVSTAVTVEVKTVLKWRQDCSLTRPTVSTTRRTILGMTLPNVVKNGTQSANLSYNMNRKADSRSDKHEIPRLSCNLGVCRSEFGAWWILTVWLAFKWATRHKITSFSKTAHFDFGTGFLNSGDRAPE